MVVAMQSKMIIGCFINDYDNIYNEWSSDIDK